MNDNNKIIKIIIEEINKLKEAAMDNFSAKVLSGMRTFKEKIAYCKEMLGNPIGNGSSRTVFQISDEKVLKLAKNAKGIAQNETEAEPGKRLYNVFPKIFYVDDNYSFIISEYVLPCKKEDFKHVLGISFDEFIDFLKYTYNLYSFKKIPNRMSTKRYRELLNNDNLSDICTYISDYHAPIGDFTVLGNLGLTIRDGKTRIVFLDDGINENVWKLYYNKF